MHFKRRFFKISPTINRYKLYQSYPEETYTAHFVEPSVVTKKKLYLSLYYYLTYWGYRKLLLRMFRRRLLKLWTRRGLKRLRVRSARDGSFRSRKRKTAWLLHGILFSRYSKRYRKKYGFVSPVRRYSYYFRLFHIFKKRLTRLSFNSFLKRLIISYPFYSQLNHVSLSNRMLSRDFFRARFIRRLFHKKKMIFRKHRMLTRRSKSNSTLRSKLLRKRKKSRFKDFLKSKVVSVSTSDSFGSKRKSSRRKKRNKFNRSSILHFKLKLRRLFRVRRILYPEQSSFFLNIFRGYSNNFYFDYLKNKNYYDYIVYHNNLLHLFTLKHIHACSVNTRSNLARNSVAFFLQK